MGLSKSPTAVQIEAMSSLVRDAMVAGAFGMSTGLEYEPGRFAGPEELSRLARPVAEHGGIVMSHIRSEDDDDIDAALAELLDQCATAGCPAHVSHLKIVYARGADRAASVLALLNAARVRGQRVTADVYPYIASYTRHRDRVPALVAPAERLRSCRARASGRTRRVLARPRSAEKRTGGDDLRHRPVPRSLTRRGRAGDGQAVRRDPDRHGAPRRQRRVLRHGAGGDAGVARGPRTSWCPRTGVRRCATRAVTARSRGSSGSSW